MLDDLINKNCINKNDIKSVIVGNVISAGMGQGPVRNIALSFGLNQDCVAYTLKLGMWFRDESNNQCFPRNKTRI